MSNIIDKLVGSGMSFPFQSNESKGVSENTSVERINQSLLILLSTRKGDRLLMPEFGSDLCKYRFDLYDRILLDRIRETLYSDIKRWEPRIVIEDIKFYKETQAIEDHTLHIFISYKIINTEVTGNFVYPYKLEVYDM